MKIGQQNSGNVEAETIVNSEDVGSVRLVHTALRNGAFAQKTMRMALHNDCGNRIKPIKQCCFQTLFVSWWDMSTSSPKAK